MKILTTPRMERCIGCHSCSLACDPVSSVRVCPTGAYSQRKWVGVVVKKKLCGR